MSARVATVLTAVAALPLALLVPAAPAAPAQAAIVDVAPQRTFTVPYGAFGMTREPGTGRYWVSGDDNAVHVYAPTATGAASQLFQVDGLGSTGPRQVAFDARGRPLVPYLDSGTVTVYPAGVSGTSPPDWVFGGLTTPVAVATGPQGRAVVAERGANAVRVLRLGAAPEDYADLGRIVGAATGLASPWGVALDPAGRVYVANAPGTVTVYPADNVGNLTPLRTITMPAGFGELTSLAFDSRGNLYVAEFSGAVAVVAPGATTPFRVLQGPATGLSGIIGLAVDRDRAVSVSRLDTPSRIMTYPALVPLQRPGGVRSLSVGGTAKDLRRVVTWRRPASVGERLVTSYAVVVRKGARVIRQVRSTTTRLVLLRKRLPAGRLVVSVRAVSAAGAGPAVSRAFRVRLPG